MNLFPRWDSGGRCLMTTLRIYVLIPLSTNILFCFGKLFVQKCAKLDAKLAIKVELLGNID